MRALTLKKTSDDQDELIGKIAFNFEETEINGLEDMQKIVGGYIETWDYISELYDNGISLYCNDEGKLQGLHPALVVTKNGETVEMICGNILFCGYDSEGETVPLTDKQISIIKSIFTRSMYVQNSNNGLNAIVGYTIDIGRRGKK